MEIGKETYENVGIGTKENLMEAKNVKVIEYSVAMQKNKQGEEVGDKLTLKVKYPGRDEPVEISKVKYQKADKLKVSGLWFNLDEDKKIPKNSAIAYLLKSNKCSTIKELVGKEIPTTLDEEGYLIAKAY